MRAWEASVSNVNLEGVSALGPLLWADRAQLGFHAGARLQVVTLPACRSRGRSCFPSGCRQLAKRRRRLRRQVDLEWTVSERGHCPVPPRGPAGLGPETTLRLPGPLCVASPGTAPDTARPPSCLFNDKAVVLRLCEEASGPGGRAFNDLPALPANPDLPAVQSPGIYGNKF